MVNLEISCKKSKGKIMAKFDRLLRVESKINETMVNFQRYIFLIKLKHVSVEEKRLRDTINSGQVEEQE